MPKIYVDRVVDDLYILRIDDDEVKYFEALWSIPEGVTYNSYVLLTNEGAVVFDSWKHVYADLFVDTLKKIVDLRDIKYIVVHHMEPDHSGAIPRLLQEAGKEPVVLGHPIAKNLFISFYGFEPKFRVVKDLEELVVGGKKLRFIYIPWLHWPDTIATYLEDLGVVLTCDAFGGYGIPKSLYDDSDSVVEEFLPLARKYLANIVGHYREHIVKNIEKLLGLGIEIKIVAPAHGLVWIRNPRTIIDYYYKLGKAEPENRKILVIYSSMYGFLEKAVNIAVEELVNKGFKVKIYRFADREQPHISDILGDAIDSNAIVLGISTYDGDIFPVIRYVVQLLIDKINADKPILIINNYAWGKLQEDKLNNLFKTSKFKIVDVVYVNGLPQENDVEKIKQNIEKLVNTIPKHS